MKCTSPRLRWLAVLVVTGDDEPDIRCGRESAPDASWARVRGAGRAPTLRRAVIRKIAGMTHTVLVLVGAGAMTWGICVSVARATPVPGVSSRVPRPHRVATITLDDSRPLTIIPQPPILPADTGQGLTDSSSFSLLLRATSGSTLACKLDEQTVSCGTPPPTCAGTVCATFTGTGETQGTHYLDVTVADAAGRPIDENDYAVTIDPTPPGSTNLQLNDGTDGITPRTLHPVFAFAALDDNQLPDADGPPDSAQCSFTPAGAPPVWSACAPHKGYDDDEDFQFTPTVPATHVDYTFEGRTVDVFGRVDPTPVSMPYDPVPCDVRVSAPRTVRKLLGTTLTATVRCTATSSAALELFLLGTDGHAKALNRVLSRGALALIPASFVGGPTSGFTARHHLRIEDILRSAETTIAHARSLSLAVVAEARTDFPYDPLPGTARFTIAKRRARRDRDLKR